MRRTALFVLPLVAGCAETPDVATAWIDDQAPPPGAQGLTLSVNGILQPGTTISFSASGAAPNTPVVFVRGNAVQTGAACLPALGGLCLDVRQPQLLRQVTANSAGVATFSVQVPANPDDTTLAFQAAQTGSGAATSNVVVRFNPRSDALTPTGNGSTTLTRVEQAVVTPAGGYQGVRTDAWSAATPGLDACVYTSPVTGTTRGSLPACAGCEFAFQVTNGPFVEIPSTGDCLRILGLDVPSFGVLTTSIAYEATYNLPPYGVTRVALSYSTSAAAWQPVALAQWDAATSTFSWEAPGVAPYSY
ncbi:MAG: hypothetical protein RLZZ383_127 [Pseudomonadota bacterium]|jgi:hypothetical protein